MSDLNDKVIAEAIDYIVAHYQERPDLSYLAKRAGYETTYFQKLFSEKVGISPKKLVGFMCMKQARELLLEGCSTLEAAHEAGLSGSGRLHDLFVTYEAITPGSVKDRGMGLEVTYGFYPTALGEILVGKTRRGVCYLGFVVDGKRDFPEMKMRAHLPQAVFTANDNAIETEAAQIMAIWDGKEDVPSKLGLDLYGTNLQIQVWQALMKIPSGKVVCYKDIAETLGKPKASRAVGNAVGANPISLLIPCHRVIQASGIVNNYGWGSPRKKLLLGLEGAQSAGVS